MRRKWGSGGRSAITTALTTAPRPLDPERDLDPEREPVLRPPSRGPRRAPRDPPLLNILAGTAIAVRPFPEERAALEWASAELAAAKERADP